MTPGLAAIAYLVAAVCFILALKGLSAPTSSRRGNLVGMIGMAIAVAVTIADPSVISYRWILAGLVIGGAIGIGIALRIQMTAMPQLVAAFHSLVGMAAVLVTAAALYAPGAYGIVGEDGAIRLSSRIEMILGMAIGAITFSGSVVAFAKLQGLVSGAPVIFRGQHLLNLLIGGAIAGCGVWFAVNGNATAFWTVAALAFLIGMTLIIPIGGADMPVVVSMLNSYSGWAAAGIGFTLENELLIITGALVGSSGAILSYIMCKGMNRLLLQRHPGRFRHRRFGAAGFRLAQGEPGQCGRRRLHSSERPQGHHRSGLRHGRRTGSARPAGNGRTSSRKMVSRWRTPSIRLPDACPDT